MRRQVWLASLRLSQFIISFRDLALLDLAIEVGAPALLRLLA